MKLTGKNIRIDKETAYKLIDCKKDSPIYNEIDVLYNDVDQEICPFIEPVGRLDFVKAIDLFPEGTYPIGTAFAILIYTLGEKISEYTSDLFSKGEYLKGMLADAMADSCLFAMEEEWKGTLYEECQKRNVGIAKRMEAPLDFPLELQKRIWELLEGEQIGISFTSGYMFSPVKTCCYLFLLSEDCRQKNTDHDCRKCTNVMCRLRNKS